jgi:hypothetical protein
VSGIDGPAVRTRWIHTQGRVGEGPLELSDPREQAFHHAGSSDVGQACVDSRRSHPLP